jgi:hypothetical protein
MAIIKSGLSLVSKFLPISIDGSGAMTVTLHTGYVDAGAWHEHTSVTYTMSATDV